MLAAITQDLRYGARMILRNPGVAAVAVVALAIGIGVNTTIFTAYTSMVARPLDARDPDRMVNLALVRASGTPNYQFSIPDYENYRDSLRSASGLIVLSPDRLVLSNAGGLVSQRTYSSGSLFGRLGLLSGGAGNAEFASIFVVSENYFSVLGVAPSRGRSFESMTVSQLIASPSVLISENYWKSRFDSDPKILGKTIHLNGAAFTIIGVTPRDFVGTSIFAPAFWLPLCLEPLVHPERNWLSDREIECCRLFARLVPGATAAKAQEEMTGLADRVRKLHPPRSELSKPAAALAWRGSPFPLPLNHYGGLMLAIFLIMAAGGLVLVVACANAGSLQLARAQSRMSEISIRLSLGASRLRVIRQLLTENTLTGLFAGVMALLITWALTRLLAVKFAEAMPADAGAVVFHVTPSVGIVVYVLAISLAASLLFGLLPALETSHSALASALKSGTATSPVRTRRLQDLFVGLQVAASLVLLIFGSMFIHSAVRSIRMETGYDSKHLIDLNLQFPEAAGYSDARKHALVLQVRGRIAAMPGVAGITIAQPPAAPRFRTSALPIDPKDSPAQSSSVVFYSNVQPDYFETLGISLLRGRAFQHQDTESGQYVVVSESAARQLWPGRNPIGRSLRLGDTRIHDENQSLAHLPAYQVIGVARDVRGVEFDGSDSKQVYLPLSESWLQNYPILIRTHSDPRQLVRPLDSAVSAIDPNLIAGFTVLDDMLRQTAPFIASSLGALVASAIGLLGLLLASMGIYGTVSYVVVLRTREVGIRMAVGARRRDILKLILRQSISPVIAGLLAGVLLATGLSFLLRRLFYGLDTVDAISFAGISVMFLAIALLAAYPPARRAMGIDPMAALRYE